jgi:AMP nucleosidase
MMTSPTILSPTPIAPELFTDAVAAVARIEEIYERNTEFLRNLLEDYTKGEPIVTRIRATYPFVRITTTTYARLDSRLSFGFVAGPGMHETTVTRPDLFRAYLIEQIGLLIENHGVAVEIGESKEPIPIHFAYRRDSTCNVPLTIASSIAARSDVSKTSRSRRSDVWLCLETSAGRVARGYRNRTGNW